MRVDGVPQTYTTTAKLLHWLIAVFVFAQIALGMWMIGIPKAPPGIRVYWFNVHKSIGITLGLIILVRLLWRLSHPAPEPHIGSTRTLPCDSRMRSMSTIEASCSRNRG